MGTHLGHWKKIMLAFMGVIGVSALLTATTAVFFFVLDDGTSAEVQTGNQPTVSEETASEMSGSLLSTWEFAGQPDDWRLVLVNFEIPVPNDNDPELETIGSVQADKRIAEDLQAMIDDAEKEGLTITLSSGYRSAERQGELFQQAVEENVSLGMNLEMADAVAAESVARAGYSEHNTGLAVDLNGVLETFDETPEYRWLQRHAHEYGFVLRYPEDKSEITGIRFEPWHYRYVGREHAEKMRMLNFCLEEYVAYLDARDSGQ